MFSWGPDKTTLLIIFLKTRASQSAKYLWIYRPIFFFFVTHLISPQCVRTAGQEDGGTVRLIGLNQLGANPTFHLTQTEVSDLSPPAHQLMKWPKRQLIRRKTFGSNLADDLLLFDGIREGRV